MTRASPASSRTTSSASPTSCGGSCRTEGSPVQRAMAYTVLAPSKQVRAVLVLLCAELCGGNIDAGGAGGRARSSSCTPRR